MKIKHNPFEYSKEVLFKNVPESIQIFEKEDEAYFLFSEFADFIIENAFNLNALKKVIVVLNELLEKENESIETMMVIQVFQKIYPLEKIKNQVQSNISGITLKIFNKYFEEYNKPIKEHPSLKKYRNGRIVYIEDEDE